MTYTAQDFINSPRFMEITTKAAIERMAKLNGQSVANTKAAFRAGAETLQKQVADLVVQAAEECAKRENAK